MEIYICGYRYCAEYCVLTCLEVRVKFVCVLELNLIQKDE